MQTKPISTILILWLLLGLSCKPIPSAGGLEMSSAQKLSDTSRFNHLLHLGDSVYATKNSFSGFSDAMLFFDSAFVLAEKEGDSLFIAEAIFAKARVYDAWNKAPDRTIAFFKEAADILGRTPGMYIRSQYARHLLAHAYDKAGDSARCCQILQSMCADIIKLPDTVRRQMPYISEMALIATQVRNYSLANNILQNLFQRDWIKNDSNTFNYLDHYYIARSRIAILNRHEQHSPFLDSLEMALGNVNNLMDTMYYCHELSSLYEYAGNARRALLFQKLSNDASQILNNREGIGNMQNRLLQSDLENEKRKQEMAYKEKKARFYVMLALSIGFLSISVLLLRLHKQNKRYKAQSDQLANANEDLDKKVSEIDLLNKEMQHRIKNNLQTVFSLLQMQERNTTNNETLEELQQARLRIESIATLHEHLTYNNKEQKVDFNKYITSMANKVVDCFANGKQVILNLTIEDANMPENKNFPLALILNEWITNSMKYAEPHGNILSVDISLKKVQDCITIHFKDNGAADNKVISKAGLGTQIVTLLCAQMKSTLVTDGKPFNYILTLPYAK